MSKKWLLLLITLLFACTVILVAQEVPLNEYSLPEKATTELKGRSVPYTVHFNGNKWSVEPVDSTIGTEFMLLHKTEAAFAHVEAEEREYPKEEFVEKTKEYFSLEAESVKILESSKLEINGKVLNFLSIDVFDDEEDHYIYHVYSYTGTEGTIRITMGAKSTYIEYFADEFKEFAQGLIIDKRVSLK